MNLDTDLRKEPGVSIALSIIGGAVAVLSGLAFAIGGFYGLNGIAYSGPAWQVGLLGLIGGLLLVGVARIIQDVYAARLIAEQAHEQRSTSHSSQ